MEEKIKKFDKGNSLGSLEQLSDQFEQTWDEVRDLEYTPDYRSIDNIIIAGMGGSAYSYYVINSLFKDQLKVPLMLSNDYGLPKYADENSLVIGSSYSGTTEETISGAEEALKRNSKLTFISSGGRLKEIAEETNLPGYFFEPKYNPSGQPRMGQGYMLLGTIGILKQIGLIDVTDSEIQSAISSLEKAGKTYKEEVLNLIPKLKNKYIIYIGAQHLSGNTHIIRNQTNETAKQFAMYALIPELNHHLMEGLSYPDKGKPHFIFFNSNLYPERIKLRFKLTKEVVEKNGAPTTAVNFSQNSKYSEFMSMLSYGGYLTFYLAMEYGLNPAMIPWVDYFKQKLS